ncbi:hypothetical protein KY319_01730 [Candidatus Woesearchaeota archaeon]|nr:hypothetical protein [Candidatus Woesearchaeota archaeon]
MKKIIILLFLLPSVLAISLSVPEQREIIYEPLTEQTLAYSVGNSDPVAMAVGLNVDAGKLENHISIPVKELNVPPFGMAGFTVKINFPPELSPGLYTLRAGVSEKSQAGGMAGLTGAMDIINIISPYEKGYPHITIHVNQYQQAGAAVPFLIEVQNIGETDLQNIQPIIMLYRNNQREKETTTSIQTNLQPYQKQKFQSSIDTEGLTPGYYDLIVKAGQTEAKQIIALGKPTVTVTNYPSFKAGEENTFEANINVDNWSGEIENASVTFHITNLLSSYQIATLYPGVNTLEFTTEARPGKTGTYLGRVRINGNLVKATGYFSAEVEGSKTQAGVGFTKTPEKAEEQEEETEEQTPTKTIEKIKETAKNQIFLILLLIASFAIFAFALGQYLARRRMNNAPPFQ